MYTVRRNTLKDIAKSSPDKISSVVTIENITTFTITTVPTVYITNDANITVTTVIITTVIITNVNITTVTITTITITTVTIASITMNITIN